MLLPVLLFLFVFKSESATFVKNPCTARTEDGIADYVSAQLEDVTSSQVKGLLTTSDALAERAMERTWASHKTGQEIHNLFTQEVMTINKANSARFGYPWGETSGGFGSSKIIESEPGRTWEQRSREIADRSIAYMIQLSAAIPGYIDLFKPKALLDCGVPRRFHATHAEIKLLTRLMIHGDLPFGKQVLISVSRHMCYNCRKIVAHLARNGRRKILVATPRKGRKIPFANLQQPEYIFFKEDGSYEVFERSTPHGSASFKCINVSFSAIPDNLDTYMPPRADVNQRTFDKRTTCEDIDRQDGPGNECFHFIRESLTKAIACPPSGTMTGIHGTFGTIEDAFPLVLRSIGIYCDVILRQPATGLPGEKPFELKCPELYQMTGIYGVMGDFVDKIGILCTRISDGAGWRSALFGFSEGGSPVEKRCKDRAAGHKMKIWPGEKVIDGLGMCCR